MPRNSKKVKPYLTTFLLILVLFLAFFFVTPQGEPISKPTPPAATVAGVMNEANAPQEINGALPFPVYFTDPGLQYEGQKIGGIEEYLIQMIDTAKISVDLAVFEFDLEDVAEALMRAEKRGVDVRIVHDDEHTAADPQVDALASAGISVVPDERSAYMHNKFFIVDAYCVWTGSFNISANAAFKNNENAVVICDEKLAKNYEAEFEEMYEGNFGPKSPANTQYPSLIVGGVQIENYFAPEDDVMNQVIRTVVKAKQSVHFMAFSFTDDNLANTMVDLKKNGLDVSGIFESRGASGTGSSCPELVKGGANVALDGNKYTFHHKVIIVDGEVVVFGSFNFSANADQQNDENLLIVHNKDFAQKFEDEFRERWIEGNKDINADCTIRK